MTDPKSTSQAGTTMPNWIRRLGPGEVLFHEGDDDRRVYILLDGKVEIVKEADRVAEIGVGDPFIGELSALTGKPRWATARTLVASTLLVVDEVGELFRADPSWALRLATVLATRLDRVNERLRAVEEALARHLSRSGEGAEVFDGLASLVRDSGRGR